MSRKGSPKGEAVNSHFGLSPTLKTSKLQGVQTRSQTAKRDRNMTPIQDLKNVCDEDSVPCTPVNQGIPLHTGSIDPPGAPQKSKGRRTQRLSPNAPAQKETKKPKSRKAKLKHTPTTTAKAFSFDLNPKDLCVLIKIQSAAGEKASAAAALGTLVT